MSHGKHHGRDESCVCDAVEKILAEQEAVEEQCPTGCYTNLLSPTIAGKDTIPFLVFDKKGGLFSTFGNVGGFADDSQCFESIFFRVERLCDSLRDAFSIAPRRCARRHPQRLPSL